VEKYVHLFPPRANNVAITVAMSVMLAERLCIWTVSDGTQINILAEATGDQ